MNTKCILLSIFLFPLAGGAQPGANWFEDNDQGNRYEGSYTRKVSNPSLYLVSLTGSVPNYTFGEKQKLSVRFYSPEEQEYQLHAEELLITRFYWLQDKNTQAKKGWNEFSDWHADYALKTLSIDARNLGILARLGEGGSRKFSPAIVEIEGLPSTPPTRYIAQLRLGRPVASGSFNIFLGESRTADNLLIKQAVTAKSAGTVFPIVIPLKKLGDTPQWITVEVNLKEKNTLDPFTYSFSFFHQPLD